MRIEELAALNSAPPRDSVPDWTLGCFRRASITFHNGATDRRTEVYWLQSRGLTADLRLPPSRPNLHGRASLDECAPEELIALAEVEGGLASTSWDGTRMSWSAWDSFQLHDKWPEPAILRRVGDCLIEIAPSGVYVEEWRFQPTADGPLVGLRLIEERDLDCQTVRHRGGGLVVCGRHAALVRGRPKALPPAARLDDLVRAHGTDHALMTAVFAFEASYARRDRDGPFIVHRSTNPLREAQPLLALDGFALDAEARHVRQRVREDGRFIERLFTIDCLESGVTFPIETPATPEARDWLKQEAGTLLAQAGMPD